MVFKLITTAAVIATAATTCTEAIPLQSQKVPRGIVGTTEHTGETFLRFLTTHAHCADGKVCAITMQETCAWTQDELTQPVSTTSVIVQNQRGSRTAPTYIFDAQGSFQNLAQNNNQAVIELSKFQGNKIVFADSYGKGSSWSSSATPCKMYGASDDWNSIFNIGQANTKSDGTDSESFNTFCIDFTDIIEAENQKGNKCQAYIIQTAKMTTPLHSMAKAVAKQTHQKINIINTAVTKDITNDNILNCFKDQTNLAENQCKTNTTAMSSNSEFYSCIKGHFHTNCVSGFWSKISANLHKNVLPYSKNVDTNFNTENNAKMAKIISSNSAIKKSLKNMKSIQNIVSTVEGTPMTLFESYGGYKEGKKGFKCGNSIATAVKTCAVKALKSFVTNEVLFNAMKMASIGTKDGLTPKQAGKAQSLQYKMAPGQSKTHPDFGTALKKTEVGTAIMSAEAGAGAFAGCMIGSIIAQGACKSLEKNSKDDDSDSGSSDTTETDGLIGDQKLDFQDLEFEFEDVDVDSFNEIYNYGIETLTVADDDAVSDYLIKVGDGSVVLPEDDTSLNENLEHEVYDIESDTGFMDSYSNVYNGVVKDDLTESEHDDMIKKAEAEIKTDTIDIDDGAGGE